MAGQRAKYLEQLAMQRVTAQWVGLGLLLTVGARLGATVGLFVPVQAIMARKSISNAQIKRFDILGFIFSPL